IWQAPTVWGPCRLPRGLFPEHTIRAPRLTVGARLLQGRQQPSACLSSDLNVAGTDSLGAVPLTARPLSGAYHPCASINSGGSVASGATATFSMSFISPDTAGTA